MTPYVVDSSVAIKWYVAEPLAAEASRVQTGPHPLHSPEFLDVEVANILWKKVRKGEITRADADDILAALKVVPIAREPDINLIAPAFDLAVQTDRTVYDCLYLALAVQLNGRMVTADDRLVNALAPTPWAGYVLRLADVP
ncbi:MAG: type II toxin-antitoxin system VapC family toxin [Gemmataceae bacterium]|nr:type II toxin-antitoxin system VapC family toxin [Gemmataceae bacterium]